MEAHRPNEAVLARVGVGTGQSQFNCTANTRLEIEQPRAKPVATAKQRNNSLVVAEQHQRSKIALPLLLEELSPLSPPRHSQVG